MNWKRRAFPGRACRAWEDRLPRRAGWFSLPVLMTVASGTGKELWVTRLEANGHATPMTFWGKKSHKQFVVIAAGGSGLFGTEDRPEKASDALDAFALPDK